MPKVSLPQRNATPRVGLAVLWKSEPVQTESFRSRVAALLTILGNRLRAAPLAALAAVVSLTAVMTISFLLIVIGNNLRNGLTYGTEQVSIRVVPLSGDLDLLGGDSAMISASTLSNKLAKLPNVRSVRVIDKRHALEEFSNALGSSRGLLEGLETDNPLPVTIELSLTDLGPDPAKTVNALVEQVHRQEGVAEVVYNNTLISSLGELLRGVKYFGVMTVIAVLLIGALLVGMTIRLGVYAHRHEIEVMQLIGADRRQIQLPFIVEGVGVGLCAGVLAYGLIALCVGWLGAALTTSQIGWVLGGESLRISPFTVCAIVVTGPILSLVGALWAVRMQGER